MKRNITVLIICLFTPLNILQAQKAKVIVSFKNGDTITGFGKIKGNYLKYRKNYKEKATKIHFSKLERVKIHFSNETISYVYLKVKNKDEYKVLEEVVNGNVNLYKLSKQVYNPGFMGANGTIGGVGFNGGYSYNINSFYVKKIDESEAIHLGSNELFLINFKKAASEFFKDCPDLVKKIQAKELKKETLSKL